MGGYAVCIWGFSEYNGGGTGDYSSSMSSKKASRWSWLNAGSSFFATVLFSNENLPRSLDVFFWSSPESA